MSQIDIQNEVASPRQSNTNLPSLNGDFYDRDYFLKGTKSNYGGDFTPYSRRFVYPQAERLANLIKKMFRGQAKSIMVYGCARGYLVEALRQKGYEAVGVDISTWAIRNATPKSKKHVHLSDITEKQQWQNNYFDILIAEDVFEHIPENKIPQMLTEATRITKKFLMLKIAVEDPEKKDRSHITIWNTQKWLSLLAEHGWQPIGKPVEVKQSDKITSLVAILTKLGTQPKQPKLTTPKTQLMKIKDATDGDILKWYGRSDTPERFVDNPAIQNKKVLVLIPCYNNESILRIWFNYLYRLNPQPTEYVFAENNSNDETLKLVSQFKRPHKLIRVWFKNQPIGKDDTPYLTIAHIRQLLLTYARNSNCDYAIFLDTDIFPITEDLIEHLVNWNLDVVGGKYLRFFPDGLKVASYWHDDNPEKPFRLRSNTALPFEEVACTSGGCLCLSRRIIQDRKLDFYPIEDTHKTSEDFGYCNHARKLGYKIYLDSLVDLRHLAGASDRKDKPWTEQPNGELTQFSYGEKQE